MVIERKEIQLTENSSASMQAIYSADTGIDCVQYLDLKGSIATSSGATAIISCNGQTAGYVDRDYSVSNRIEYKIVKSSSDDTPFTFKLGLNIADENSACFDIESIIKETSATNPWILSTTTIRVNGYNTCNVDDPRRAQRTLEVVY
jgi:hypothetical protein